ncbi:D-alanine--D-alanine ligase, partial [Patescibacteria group bacterium]|nr:D-alanine--D-alanine ligase [Patescibacteria group bacterium]
GDGKSQGMASAKRQILKKLEPEVLKLIQETAKKVYICLGCAGLARVDFLIKENPLQAYVIEINTLPGSLAFYLWDAKGVSFRNLTTKLIELAQERFVSDNKNIHTFSSNILKDFKPGVKNSKSDQ